MDLFQRLRADPVFRAAYLAGAASPLESLDARESRSSLAGVVAGTALEAVALLGLADGAEAAVGPILDNHNLTFDADGLADLRAGRIDPRVVSVLDHLSREHHLTISSMRSDHDRLTSGGSVSNHSFGRAVDIAAIDGRPVTPDNAVARHIAEQLGALDPSIRPTEIGSPWSLPGAAYFTDAEHQNHLHIAFDDPPPPGAGSDATVGAAGDADSSSDGDVADGDAASGEDVADGDAASGGDGDVAHDDADAADGNDADGDTADSDAASGDDVAHGDADAADGNDADGSDGDTADGDDDDGADDDDSDDEDDDDTDVDGQQGSDDADDGDSDDEDDSDDDDSDDEDSDDDSDDEDEPDEDEPDERGPDQDDLEDPDRVDPDRADAVAAADHVAAAAPALDGAVGQYPGPGASKAQLAGWMAARAQARGLPGELPVMAALVESGLANLEYGDADSVGFFQMRASVWNSGPYVGYADKPELQLNWFLDQAEAVMKQRVARGLPVDDPRHFGDWIADVERPAEQYRGRYQLRFDEARGLLDRLASGARKLRLITPEEAARARGG